MLQGSTPPCFLGWPLPPPTRGCLHQFPCTVWVGLVLSTLRRTHALFSRSQVLCAVPACNDSIGMVFVLTSGLTISTLHWTRHGCSGCTHTHTHTHLTYTLTHIHTHPLLYTVDLDWARYLGTSEMGDGCISFGSPPSLLHWFTWARLFFSCPEVWT